MERRWWIFRTTVKPYCQLYTEVYICIISFCIIFLFQWLAHITWLKEWGRDNGGGRLLDAKEAVLIKLSTFWDNQLFGRRIIKSGDSQWRYTSQYETQDSVERHDGGRRAKITLMPSLPNMHYKKIPTLATYTGLAGTAACNTCTVSSYELVVTPMQGWREDQYVWLLHWCMTNVRPAMIAVTLM